MQKKAQPQAQPLNPQAVLDNANSAIFSAQMRNHAQRAVPWVGGGLALGSLLGGIKLLGQTMNKKPAILDEEKEPELQFGVPKPLLNKRAGDLNNLIGPSLAVGGTLGGGLLGYKLVQAIADMNKKKQRRYMENQAIGDLSSAVQDQYQQARPKDMLTSKAAAALDQLAETVVEKKAEWPITTKALGMGLGAASPFFLLGAYQEYQRKKELEKQVPAKARMLKAIADAQKGPAPLQINAVPQ